MYCKIVDGQITETRSTLPQQVTFPDGTKCGNFDLLDPSKQVDAGWYTLVENQPEYDARIERITASGIAISGTIVTRSWEIEGIALTDLQTSKVEAVNIYRDALLEYSTMDYSHNGEAHPIEVSPTAKSNITGRVVQLEELKKRGQLPPVIPHACSDGHILLLTPDEFATMALAFAAHADALYTTSFTKRAQIMSLIDPLSVATFDVEGGW